MGLKDYLTFSKNFQRVGDKRHAKKKKETLCGGTMDGFWRTMFVWE